jgi:DNA-binding LacI/PurR family transcriptional regulator
MKALSSTAQGGGPARATIADVAERAGVSAATVSRAINAPDAVRPETRARIEAAMESLAYVPNPAGRGLASGRTGNVGALFLLPSGSTRSDVFFADMLRGIEDAVAGDGYAVMTSVRPAHDPAADAAPDDPPLLGPGRVDGLIVAGGPLPPRLCRAIRRTRLPAVFLGPTDDDPDAWSVVANSRWGAEQAVAHLLGQGRRRVVHIAGPVADATAARKREGYRLAHERAGVAVDPALHAADQARHSRERGRRTIERLIDEGVGFDAVYADDDLLALGALSALAARGRRVPDDVAVAGYGDLEDARFAHPPLTSVHVDFRQQGWLAGTLLAKAVAGQAPGPVRIELEARLVIRASSTTAPEREAGRSPHERARPIGDPPVGQAGADRPVSGATGR